MGFGRCGLCNIIHGSIAANGSALAASVSWCGGGVGPNGRNGRHHALRVGMGLRHRHDTSARTYQRNGTGIVDVCRIRIGCCASCAAERVLVGRFSLPDALLRAGRANLDAGCELAV